MDLKEYIQIIRHNFSVFMVVIAAVVVGSFAFFYLKPVSYSTSLALNITRSGAQQTADYKYDDFYRLQADEKFAETITEWLKDPRVVADTYALAGLNVNDWTIRQLSESFVPEKLSSQLVTVSFSARSAESAKKIANAIAEEISKNTAALNKDQNENTWFEVAAQSPVIAQDKMNPLILLAASFAAGIFLAFWAVLIIYYLK